MNSTLMRIVLQKFDEAKFVEELTKWAFYISEYDRATNERLPASLKTTLLATKTSGPTYRYLCMSIDDPRGIIQTMVVVNYCRTST